MPQSSGGIYKRIITVNLLTTFAIVLIVVTINAKTVAIARESGHSQTLSSSYTHTIFLPVVTSHKPCDVSGYATLHTQPVSNTVFGLSYSSWEGVHALAYTTTTAENGLFCFSSVPLLPSCRGWWYHVYFGYGLTPPQEDYATGWAASLVRCDVTQVFTNIHAELSDITILTPADDMIVALPATFSWADPAIKNGYYSFQFDNCWETITAGYSTSVTITSLPQCVSAGVPTTWHLQEITNGTRWSRTHTVTFQAARPPYVDDMRRMVVR